MGTNDYKPRKDIGNIEWKDIPSSGCKVVDLKTSYICVFPNGDYRLIFWGGEDVREAMKFLRKRAWKDLI